MTRDQWRIVEPVVTKALSLPEEQRQALLESEFINSHLLREIMRAVQLGARAVTPATAGAGSPPGDPPGGSPPAGAPPPSDPPLPRRRFVTLKPDDALDGGRYRVIRQIARGGMGSIYLANDKNLGTMVALKVMPSDERVLTEARRAASCLGHPNVATVLNVTTTEVNGESVGLIAMEYVQGRPASLLASEGRQDVADVITWGRQVASAIAHAHSHHVLHCDLKPANIVITPEGHAKVLDFGIARTTFDDEDPDQPLCGTPPYMAPEQLFSGEFSAAGDIYSLGVTLYELISGQRPFDGNEAELRMQILLAPPPALSELVPGVPPKLQDVIEKALAKEPEQRFRSARQFERALEAIETGVLRPDSLPVPVPRAPDPDPGPGWRTFGIAAACATVFLSGMTALGALTSIAYNNQLGRSGFVRETGWDWVVWGRRTTVPTVVILVALVVAAAVIRVVWRVLARLSAALPLANSFDGAARRLRRQLHLDDIAVASGAALLLSLAAILGAIFLYRDLLPAFVTFAADGDRQRLALLSPDFVERHNAYRGVFSLVVVVSVLAWYPVLKLARAGQRVNWGAVIAGGVIVAAGLVLLHFPYRTLFARIAGETFEVVRWEGNRCYVLGQRDTQLLLLCPNLDPPRHRVVERSGNTVVPLGLRESVFQGFTTVRTSERNN